MKRKYFTVVCLVIIQFLILALFPNNAFGKLSKLHLAKIPNTYVIICPPELSEIVLPLLQYENSKGFNTKIVTTEDIKYDLSSSSISSYVIRRFLKKYYASWGIKYVLLIGSINKIPMFYVYPNAKVHTSKGSYFSAVPTDFFYSDLTSNLDSDGDGYPGELFDDNIDFSPEVYVGRIPFEEPLVVKKIVHNIVSKDSRENNLFANSRILLAASMLSYKGEDFDGINLFKGDESVAAMDFLNKVTNIDNISCVLMNEKGGVEPSIYKSDVPLSKDNFQEILKSGVGLTIFFGHGNETAIYRKWKPADTNDLKYSWNELLSSYDNISLNGGIFLSAACLTAYPENPRNLGSTLLKKGLDAYVGLTRVGWSPSYFSNYRDGGIDAIFIDIGRRLVNGESVGSAMYSALYKYNNSCKFNDIEDPIPSGQMNIFDFVLYGDPATYFLRGKSNTVYLPKYIKTLNEYGDSETHFMISIKNGNVCKNELELQKNSSLFNLFLERKENSFIVNCKLNKTNKLIQPGLYKLFISYKSLKIPIFIYIDDCKKDPFTITFNSDNGNGNLKVFATRNIEVGDFLYFDVQFKNDFLFADKASVFLESSNFRSNINIDNYYGTVNFMMKFTKGLVIPGKEIADIHFYIKRNFFEKYIFLKNIKTKNARFLPLQIEVSGKGNMLGDVNKDGKVDLTDFSMEKQSFSVSYKDPGFNEWEDLDMNGIIDGKDLSILWLLVNKIDYKGSLIGDCYALPSTFIIENPRSAVKISTVCDSTSNCNDDILCSYGSFISNNNIRFSNKIDLTDIPDNLHVDITLKRKDSRIYYFAKISNNSHSIYWIDYPSSAFKFIFLLNSKYAVLAFPNVGVACSQGYLYSNSSIVRFFSLPA